jgi:hypothetical protein
LPVAAYLLPDLGALLLGGGDRNRVGARAADAELDAVLPEQ